VERKKKKKSNKKETVNTLIFRGGGHDRLTEVSSESSHIGILGKRGVEVEKRNVGELWSG